MDLKDILLQVMSRRAHLFLSNDPLRFAHRYPDPRDREAAAFLAAALAYGRVGIISRNLEDLFGRMPEGPAAFVLRFSPASDLRRLAGFKHRFNSGDDVGALCWVLRQAFESAGTLESFFLAGDDPLSPDIGAGLSSFSARLKGFDLRPVFGTRRPPAASYFDYLLPGPAEGSACKRLCMFLRWVCRPQDGIDLGLWKGVSPARLVIPLDTHIARISRLLGLTRRNSPGWKTALEVTESLRRLDPEDPVRFDFALSHLGISEGCTGRPGTWCVPCPVAGLCQVGVRSEK